MAAPESHPAVRSLIAGGSRKALVIGKGRINPDLRRSFAV